jgi:uncharacterized protein (DUF1499 family)
MVKSLLYGTASLFVFSCAACANPGPGDLGVKDGMLPSCPARPNCVSSQSVDVRYRIEPLRYTTSLHDAQEKLLTILRSMQRTTIIVREDDYIHATSASFLFRFVDDVEFYFYAEEKTIHVRSASRLGYYDFGVNRRRVDHIRNYFSTR